MTFIELCCYCARADFYLFYKLSGFTIVRVWAYTYGVSPGKSMGFSQSWFCRKANTCFTRTAARNTVENDKRGEYCEGIVSLLAALPLVGTELHVAPFSHSPYLVWSRLPTDKAPLH